MSQFSPKRVVKLEVKSKYSPEKLNDAIKANNYKRNRNLINYFMEEGENITILEDKDWAKDLINLVEEEEKLQKIKMEQEDEEFARKLLDEEKSTELARRLHEEEESKRQEHLKKLTEIEQQDYEYVKKLQAEETKEYEKARKLEEEDKKIAERLQKIEMKDIEKEIEEYEKAWNNPKIVHGEDEEGIYILVSLPYVKKYGVLLDHTHNKIYLRAEGNDLTNGKRQYIIDTKNLLFSFDIPFMPGEKVPNERDVSGTYDESNELLKIRVKGAKMNDENRSTFMNRFKATFKRIFNS